jgi:endoglucanase
MDIDLFLQVHKYLDSDNSGTHSTCTTNNVAAFQTLATWLRQNGRQAFLSETGGGPTDSSCLTNLCQELAALNANSDVYLGWFGWAAGNFDSTYVLSETPTKNGDGSFTDVPLVTQCVAGEFNGRSS